MPRRHVPRQEQINARLLGPAPWRLGRRDPQTEGFHHGCHPPAHPPARPSPCFTHRGASRTGRRGNCHRAALRAGAVPETARRRDARPSELQLSRRAGKPQPARGPHHPAHGREIPRPLAGEAARSRCLSRRRAWRHRPAGGQRVHRRRLHPRPRHLCGEPARHHVLGTGADLRGQRQLLQRASRPPLLFRGNQARPFGRDGSLPPGARRHRRRP